MIQSILCSPLLEIEFFHTDELIFQVEVSAIKKITLLTGNIFDRFH